MTTDSLYTKHAYKVNLQHTVFHNPAINKFVRFQIANWYLLHMCKYPS